MTILPLTYLGSVDYFARLAGGGCVIDIGENWVKQTARNRCEIMTSGGVAALTVPVHGGGGYCGGGSGSGGGGGGENPAKIRTRDIRIDNSKRWQHTHWISMVSAYRSSPFFDHYEERFAPVYGKTFEFLTDLNLELLDILVTALGLGRLDRAGDEEGGAVRISENYVVPSPGDIDLRGKKALRRTGGLVGSPEGEPVNVPADVGSQNTDFQEYVQVFSDRMAFSPGLSVIDLLFCEGPAARGFLR